MSKTKSNGCRQLTHGITTRRLITKSNHKAVRVGAHTALILIDVINDLEFAGAEKLLSFALPMAKRLAMLKSRAKAAGIPVIYTNDNFGRWRSDFPRLVQYCMGQDVRGRPVVAKLAPEKDDYFILKPKHSAFFQTNLDVLLTHLHKNSHFDRYCRGYLRFVYS